MKEKIIIYQLLPRLFSNTCDDPVFNGTITQNGSGKFNDITEQVIAQLKDFGITHIWLTGIFRHATLSHYPQNGLQSSHPDIVKGNAGSPYAVRDYFDIDPDLAVHVPARMEEFESLLQRIHQQGIKVIIDFIPNHVSRDYHAEHLIEGSRNLGEMDDQSLSFSPANNFYYLPGKQLEIRGLTNDTLERFREFPAKATGNDVFRHDPDINDWYETVKLNYGVDYLNKQTFFDPLPDTWIRMTEIVLFWAGKGVDGFRCDMAGMVPVEFWHYSISIIKRDYQHILFIAELYEPYKYRDYLERGYFDYLYDKVGLYDALRAVIRNRDTTHAISRVWQSLEGLDNLMLRFLENHDEQRIASQWFAGDPWKAFPAMALVALMNQGPVMIYAGQEVGEPASGATGFSGDDGRTSIFDYATIPELQKWFNGGKCDGKLLSETQKELRKAYYNLLQVVKNYPEFSNGSFYDLMWMNEDIPNRDKIFAFLRYGGTGEERVLLIAVCFDPSVREAMIRVAQHALDATGLGNRQRISATCLAPEKTRPEPLLTSQLITIGLPVHFPESGYSVYSLV